MHKYFIFLTLVILKTNIALSQTTEARMKVEKYLGVTDTQILQLNSLQYSKVVKFLSENNTVLTVVGSYGEIKLPTSNECIAKKTGELNSQIDFNIQKEKYNH